MKTEEDLRASVQDRGLRLLALNVINQALVDIVATVPGAGVTPNEHLRLREDAFKFCFGDSPGWRASRVFWAGILGMAETDITRAAIEKLKAPPKPVHERTKKPPLPAVSEILALGPTIRLTDIAEKFDLDEGSAYSALAKLRENGFKTTLVGGRKSGTYVVTPRE